MSNQTSDNRGPWDSDEELHWTDEREVFFPHLFELWMRSQPSVSLTDAQERCDEMRLRQEGHEHHFLVLRHYPSGWYEEVFQSLDPLWHLWRHLQNRLMEGKPAGVIHTLEEVRLRQGDFGTQAFLVRLGYREGGVQVGYAPPRLPAEQ